MGVIRASEDGIISAVRLWFILAFGDEDKDEDEEGGEEGTEDEEGTEGEDEGPPCPSSGGRREGGRKGETVLDSRETHWKYAVSYLPEASFKKGERVPLMCIRSGRKGGKEGGREGGFICHQPTTTKSYLFY